MVIGDKVRMLHGNGEGVVIRVDGDRITVMLNEGLEIPLSRKHLVLVRQMKQDLPAAKEPDRNPGGREKTRPGMLFLTEGVYLAGVYQSPMLIEFHIINQTDFELFLLAYKLARPVNQFLTRIPVAPKSSAALPGSFPGQGSNHLTGLAFQFMKFHPDRSNILPANEFRIALSSLPKSSARQRIPLLEQEGFLIQMDGITVQPDPVVLKNAFFQKDEELRPQSGMRLKNREIDLHIEQLTVNAGSMGASEILQFQLQQFEKAMDDALLAGLDHLIVIHGTGNGILRAEIHRRLSQNRNIRHFRDARREKFGYGATEITF